MLGFAPIAAYPLGAFWSGSSGAAAFQLTSSSSLAFAGAAKVSAQAAFTCNSTLAFVIYDKKPVASFSGGTSLDMRGAAFASATFNTPCGTTLYVENDSPAFFLLRANCKTTTNFHGTYNPQLRFNINSETKISFAPKRDVAMRMRARSRTIMRWRSGPWPW